MATGMNLAGLRTLMVPVLAIVMLVGGHLSSLADSRSSSGVLAAANGPVEIVSINDPSAAPRRLAVGARLVSGDEIITGRNVRAQIMLRDGTTFAIGERARLAIDEFIYDPATGTGALGVVIRRGAFRFVSGRVAKTSPGNVKLIAGSTAIDVNGTEVLGSINGVSDEVILMSGEVALTSIGGACGGGAPQGDIFSVDAGGSLQSSVAGQGGSPASCSRSLVRAGFGVQIASSGQMTSPGRATATDVDTVIDAVTVKAETTPAAVLSASSPTDGAVVQVAAADAGIPALSDTQTDDGAKGVSAFDRIVMRSFGMLASDSPDSQAVDDNGDAGPQLPLATLQGANAEDGLAEEDDTGAADDKTIAEEEARYDEKVDEATRGSGESSGGSSGSSSSSDTSSPPNAAPQLAGITGFAFSDTSGDDSFSNQTGTLTGSDADSGDTLTYAISGQSADTSQSGYTHAASGSFGTLYISSILGQ